MLEGRSQSPGRPCCLPALKDSAQLSPAAAQGLALGEKPFSAQKGEGAAYLGQCLFLGKIRNAFARGSFKNQRENVAKNGAGAGQCNPFLGKLVQLGER